MNRLKNGLLLGLSALLGVCGLVAAWAVIGALSVRNTLVAIESAFGSLVLAALLFALAWKAFQAGRARLRAECEENSAKQSHFE